MDSNGIIVFADEYQDRTKETEIYTEAGETFIDSLRFDHSGIDLAFGEHLIEARDMLSLMHCAGKLNGEAGEVAELVFKAYRSGSKVYVHQQEAMLKELGDVLWYVARIADLCGFRLSEVMSANIKKLADRKERGVIHGYGDER